MEIEDGQARVLSDAERIVDDHWEIALSPHWVEIGYCRFGIRVEACRESRAADRSARHQEVARV